MEVSPVKPDSGAAHGTGAPHGAGCGKPAGRRDDSATVGGVKQSVQKPARSAGGAGIRQNSGRSVPVRRSKSIAVYGTKRDFERTPEPPAETRPAGGTPVLPGPGRAFVVHRHEARRLHYDLRLEMNGVLASWAVPKGFSYDPEVKKLAVRTEDHPLAYTAFEGVIPEGEYGGGTMGIWDLGRYEIEEGGEDQGAAGVAAGKLVIRLRGRKLRGSWHMVRTTRGEHEWLLIKGRDRYVRPDADRQPFFALEAAVPWSGTVPPAPVLPQAESGPMSDPEYLFEPELRGAPVFLERSGGEVRLSPAGEPSPAWPTEVEERLPEIFAAADALRAEEFLAHGALVSTDAAERPSEEALARRLGGDRSVPVVLYLNDLIRYEDWDVRGSPLRERKALLSTLLPESAAILFGDHVAVRGEEFHAACEAAGLPGTIARRADAPYPPSPPGEAAPEDCLRIPAKRAPESPDDHLLAGLSREQAHRNAARPVRFTNLDKVFWPDQGYTKGDLIPLLRPGRRAPAPVPPGAALPPAALPRRGRRQGLLPEGPPGAHARLDRDRADRLRRQGRDDPLPDLQRRLRAPVRRQPGQHRHPPLALAPHPPRPPGLGGLRPRPRFGPLLRRGAPGARLREGPSRNRAPALPQDLGGLGAPHPRPAGADLPV